MLKRKKNEESKESKKSKKKSKKTYYDDKKTYYNDDQQDTDIKDIILEELKNIKLQVKDDNIKFVNNKISKKNIKINDKEYEVPYDIYVKYIIATTENVNVKKDNQRYSISQLYDNNIVQNIYKMLTESNIEINCKTYKISFKKEFNSAFLYSSYNNENITKILYFNQNDTEKYSLNEKNILNSFLPDILNCNSKTFIMNSAIYEKGDNIGHRNMMLFKRSDFGNKILFDIYIYEPHGTESIDPVYNTFINELNIKSKLYKPYSEYDKDISFHLYVPYFEHCPIGIQNILQTVDTGLCVVYSYFWCYLFIKCSTNERFINNDYETSRLIYLLENNTISSIKKIMSDNENILLIYKLLVQFGYYTINNWFKQQIDIDMFIHKLIPPAILNNYIINNI